MLLFGMAYAVASLGCAIGPFLALVVSSLRAGSAAEGLLLFVAYAAGMGLVIGVTAVAVALLRVGVVAKVRRAGALVPRFGGAVLVVTGAYVAWYGAFEVRLASNSRASGHDPIVDLAATPQHRLSELIARVGPGWLVVLLLTLVLIGLVSSLARRPRSVGADRR
jgi:hypothetical protein